MQPLPVNPLVARAIQRDTFPSWQQLGWLFGGVTVGSFALLVGLYSVQPKLLDIALSAIVLYLISLSLLVALRSAYFTEKTLHAGYYDLILGDLSDREIVLGHMLIGLFWVREWLTIGAALIIPFIFITPLWSIAQDWSCAEVALSCGGTTFTPFFLLPVHLLVGLAGLNIFSAALGVAISLRWGKQSLVWFGTIGGIVIANLLWLSGFYTALMGVKSLDISEVKSFSNYLLITTILSSFLIIYSMTFHQQNATAVGAKFFISVTTLFTLLLALSKIALALMGLSDGESQLVVIMAVFMSILVFIWLGIMRLKSISYHQERGGKKPLPAVSYPQIEIAMMTCVGLGTLAYGLIMMFIASSAAWIGLIGSAVLMILPYLLGISTMLLAERWTERPLDYDIQPTSTEY